MNHYIINHYSINHYITSYALFRFVTELLNLILLVIVSQVVSLVSNMNCTMVSKSC